LTQVLIEAARWPEAAAAVEANLAAWPDDLESQLAQVRVLLELGRIDDLAALAGRLDPAGEHHTPLLVLSVAQALVIKDRRKEALALLDKLQEAFSENENMILATASLLVDEGQFERATGLLERYRAGHAEAYLTALLLTEIYVQQKRYDEAHALIDSLPEAVRTKNEEDLLRLRGQLFHRQKQFAEALKIYQDLSGRYPKNAQYYLEAAMVHQEMGQMNEAEQNYRRALELDPEDAEANNALGYFYAETNQKLDEALALVQKALTLNPRAGHIIDSLGWVFYRLGRFQDAVTSLEEAVELMKETPDAVVYEHLGDAHEKAGDTAKAREAWRKALDLDKDSPVLQEKVGRYGDHTAR
jgi:tetratricopeptide (TPR) repeat protein